MKQEMKLAACVLQNLPLMSADVMQGWIDNPAALRDFLAPLAPAGEQPAPKVKVKRNRYLKKIGSATLAPTTGATTLAEAADVFTGYVSPDLKNWGTNKSGADTKTAALDIYEIKADGNYHTLFGSLSKNPRSLCLSQGQIKEFGRTHRHLLRQDGYATFFLFEVDGELFVARVNVRGGQLKVNVRRFGHGDVWYARHLPRVVVPQQTV